MRFSEKDFLDCVDVINGKNYDYGNDVLYRNCGFDCLPVPGASPIDTKLSSVIWLIGKSYSADPTRSAPKNTFSNNGLGRSFETIANGVYSLSEYTGFYEELKSLTKEKYDYDYGKDQKLLERTVLLLDKLNWMMKKAMKTIAEEKGNNDSEIDNVVSFCSKFLHFMCPHLFFIIDSISLSGGAALFANTKGRRLDVSDINPSTYIEIDTAKAFMKEQYQDVSPQSLDSSGLNGATKTYCVHCLRAYRLACFLNANGKKCEPQITGDPDSCYMPRLVDAILMRITKDTEKE